MNVTNNNYTNANKLKQLLAAGILSVSSFSCLAAPTLEHNIKITDKGLFFDGIKRSVTQARSEPYVDGQKYNFAYGRSIVPHGDAIKVYKNFVFMTWYRGGMFDRHVMLTRYNMETGEQVDLEFPHQHTGFEGRWWVGETHNTIAVGISPKDETIHLLYDMHAYTPGKSTGGNGSFKHDYFRYSYSLPGAATIEDDKFTLTQFVKDTSPNNEGSDDYKHVTMTGVEDANAFGRLSYPKFFLNDQGDLFVDMRQGSSYDGSHVFNMYHPDESKWGNFKRINVMGAGSKGDVKDWSIYGSMKFENGKMRIGFQRRLNRPDKFYANEGIYYAYSDDPTGATQWKNYKGELITMPIVAPDEASVFDPSTLLPDATAKDQVSITGGFHWAVTDNGDVHIFGRTSERVDNKNKQTIYSHHYQIGGEGEFITTTDFPGAQGLYAAGENIYIIGLDDGRPFIEKAKGGTNDFTRIYQAPANSITYEKGRIHINQGKLYYYLLEKNGSGDTRTTHLQVIDLDLPVIGPDGFKYSVKEGGSVKVTGAMDIAFGVDGDFAYLTNQQHDITCNAATFSVADSDTPQACFTLDVTPTISIVDGNKTLTEGYDTFSISVQASTAAEGRTISQVALYIDDMLVGTDYSAPYQWTSASQLMNLAVGLHTINAVLTDSTGLTAETSAKITINAKPVESKPEEPKSEEPVELKSEDKLPEEIAPVEDSSSGGSTTGILISLLTLAALHRKRYEC